MLIYTAVATGLSWCSRAKIFLNSCHLMYFRTDEPAGFRSSIAVARKTVVSAMATEITAAI